MAPAVGADRVSCGCNLTHRLRIRCCHAANHEIRRFDTLCRQYLQDLLRMRRQRAVVEGDHNLMVVERQALVITHRADLRLSRWIDLKHTAHPEGIGVIAFRGMRGGTDCEKGCSDRSGEGARLEHSFILQMKRPGYARRVGTN